MYTGIKCDCVVLTHPVDYPHCILWVNGLSVNILPTGCINYLPGTTSRYNAQYRYTAWYHTDVVYI